jgi:hypothetical protein
MSQITYTNSLPGTIVDCFPVSASLADWNTAKVRLTESAAPNAGRWTGELEIGQWAVFEGGTNPSSFAASVGTISVEEPVAQASPTVEITYTNSLPGTIVDCFPVTASLADWNTAKVRLTESATPNAGRWTGELEIGQWAVFEGGTTPSSFAASVGTISVEDPASVDPVIDGSSEIELSIDADHTLVRSVLDLQGNEVPLPACKFVLCDKFETVIANLTPLITGNSYTVTIPRSVTLAQRTLFFALRRDNASNLDYDRGLIRFVYAATV